MMNSKHICWIAAAAWVSGALAVSVSLSGCSPAQSQTGAQVPKLPQVDVSNPIADTVIDYEEFTGRVDAVNKVGIQSMVTGYLQEIYFVDGAEASKDQPLFAIDPRIYQAAKNLAAASVEQAKARFERLTSDYERGKGLVQGGSLSREDFEKLVGDRLEAAAAQGQAQAQLEQAEVNLKFTKVHSPIRGKVSRRLIDKGNMVKANDTMLTWVYQIDPMYGYFDVDERTVIKIRKLINAGKLPSYHDATIDVEVGLADEESFSLKGAIDWVDNVLDAGTGTLKIRAVIRQPEKESKAQVLVSPGMFVRVRMPISAPHQAVLISEKAVGTDQSEKYVLVVHQKMANGAPVKTEDKKDIYIVDRRNVTMGQIQKGLRVVEKNSNARGKNLLPTDRVIVSGLQRVKKGTEVTIVPVDMPQADPQLLAGAAKSAPTKGRADH